MLEEIFLHEGAHTSLDSYHSSSSGWIEAQIADNGNFISDYAKEYPQREDVAETITFWIAVRCKPGRISKSNYKKILEGIPNRLKYLDEQNFDTYPLVCNE